MANFRVPLSDDFKISVGQARVICECLNITKDVLKDLVPANVIVEQTIKLKIDSINKILPIIERSAQYDFNESLEKCRNGQCRRENIGDVGADTFTIMANRKSTDKNKNKKEEPVKKSKPKKMGR